MRKWKWVYRFYLALPVVRRESARVCVCVRESIRTAFATISHITISWQLQIDLIITLSAEIEQSTEWNERMADQQSVLCTVCNPRCTDPLTTWMPVRCACAYARLFVGYVPSRRWIQPNRFEQVHCSATPSRSTGILCTVLRLSITILSLLFELQWIANAAEEANERLHAIFHNIVNKLSWLFEIFRMCTL